jgi:hypothetical protein
VQSACRPQPPLKLATLPRAVAAGVQKAPKHEVAVGWAPAVRRELGGFDGGAQLEGGCDAGRMRRRICTLAQSYADAAD